MPLHKAILAAHVRQAAPPHRLHLAVAHAGQIGAHDIGGRLQHALLLDERLDVEAEPPESTALGIDRNRRVHAAQLNAQIGRGGFD